MENLQNSTPPDAEIDAGNTSKLRHRVNTDRLMLPILILLLAAGAIYGVYSWQHSQVEDLNSQLTATKQEVQKLSESNDALTKATKQEVQKLSESNDALTKATDDDDAKTTDQTGSTAEAIDPFPCGEPQTSSNGGPIAGHKATNQIEYTTGWAPAHIDIKVGTTVTWTMSLGGDIPAIAIASDSGSCEEFNSPDLITGASFLHTFNKVGVFGWHDKYDGNKAGYTISVTE